jgi:hypothetical protein
MMTMTSTGYVEVVDLHPRVWTALESWGYCCINEYKYVGGSIDFVAVNRELGHVAIIECKTRITHAQPVIDQVNRYYEVFGVQSAYKWVFTFHIKEDQRTAFEAQGISIFEMDMGYPVQAFKNHFDEFYWYYHKWQTSPILPHCRTNYRKDEIESLSAHLIKRRDAYPYPFNAKKGKFNPSRHSLWKYWFKKSTEWRKTNKGLPPIMGWY